MLAIIKSIGRAFPHLEMTTGNLHDIPVAPAFVADSFGNVTTLHSGTPQMVEKYFRAICSVMGSTAAVAIHIMNGKQAKKTCIAGSLSRIKALGSGQERYNTNPIASGIIVDVEQRIEDGFLLGKVIIETSTGPISVHFQNEYLMVFEASHVLAATPDIIAIADAETALPLSVEQVKFGLRVNVLSLPCDPIWKTEKGLSIVGPKAFGYTGEVQ